MSPRMRAERLKENGAETIDVSPSWDHRTQVVKLTDDRIRGSAGSDKPMRG